MTNFEQWLDTLFKSEAAPKEILDLYKVVESPAKGAIGNFGITKDQNEGWVVSCKSVAEKLSIAHERDRIVFLSLIHTKYVKTLLMWKPGHYNKPKLQISKVARARLAGF